MKIEEAYSAVFTAYPDVVSAEQMCQMLGGISVKTGYQLLRTGQIKSFLIGRQYRIPKVNIMEYLNLIEKPAEKSCA